MLDDPVMARDVADLVREHSRRADLRPRAREHAGVHIDVPVRERKRVRRRVAQHEELVLDIVVSRHRPNLVAHAAHEPEHLRVVVEQRLRCEIASELLRLLDQVLLVPGDRHRVINAGGRRRGRHAEEDNEPKISAVSNASCAG